jgi:hypothetical protein
LAKLWKVALCVGLVLLMIFSVFAALSWSKAFLFSKNLDVQLIYPEFAVLKDSGNDAGDMWITTSEPVNSLLCRMWIDINHYNGTVLDSVTFTFSRPFGQGNIVVYAEAGYPNNPLSYSDDRGATVITVEPYGSASTHTFHFDFVIEKFGASQVTVKTELLMHQGAILQFSSIKASVTMEHKFLYSG